MANKESLFPYELVTYDKDTEIDRKTVYLSKPYITDPYGDDVPFTVGSNQELVYVGD